MPQVFNVLCCCECSTYQVQQVKKSNKWVCKMCGMKQSVKKVYGSGSAPECRHHVQKLNLLKSQGTAISNIIPVQLCEDDISDHDYSVSQYDDNNYSYDDSEYNGINESENENKVGLCNRSAEKLSYSSPRFTNITENFGAMKNGIQYLKQPVKRSAAEILSIIGSPEEIIPESKVKRKPETNIDTSSSTIKDTPEEITPESKVKRKPETNIDTSSSTIKDTHSSSAEKLHPMFQMQATNSRSKNIVTEHGNGHSSTAQDFDFLI